ncbi:MAG TPA: phosphonate C-P lyase system protein PhnG [Acetobacteraceae bacterium]|jgi:alpha-D-ribose 1-methylphosphonate 5-triphosphate synthase subunit PhnG
MADAAPFPEPHAERRRWMAVLARASGEEIAARLGDQATLSDYTRLRGPEAGLVMVRGRIGGGGGAFNLGEMTVTRCTVRIESGLVGHAYVAGRDGRQAELAALVDAMLQDPETAPALQADIIEPLAAAQQQRRDGVAAKAAATQVQFFAMQNMRT